MNYTDVTKQDESGVPRISGTEKVLERFGRWASFHDAEILQVKLERCDAEGVGFPTIDIVIHCWEMTGRVLPSGYCELDKHSLIHFRFLNVSSLQLAGLNHQNVINGLWINEIETGSLEISIDSIYGLEGSFIAASGEVVSVEQFDPSLKHWSRK